MLGSRRIWSGDLFNAFLHASQPQFYFRVLMLTGYWKDTSFWRKFFVDLFHVKQHCFNADTCLIHILWNCTNYKHWCKTFILCDKMRKGTCCIVEGDIFKLRFENLSSVDIWLFRCWSSLNHIPVFFFNIKSEFFAAGKFSNLTSLAPKPSSSVVKMGFIKFDMCW